jgi:hypothetical protein
MTRQNLEEKLFRLAAEWPLQSVAESVIVRIENLRMEPVSRWRQRGRQSAVIVAAAALLLALVPTWLLIFGRPRTLQAEVQQAIAKAGSAHVTISALDEKGVRREGEIWYSRDHGFRAESPDEIILDDGRQQLSWRPGVESDLIVSRRASRDAITMIAESFQWGNTPGDWNRERAADHDREINGRMCQGFIITPPPPNSFRIIVLVDADQRVMRTEDQRQVDGQWRSGREVSIDYDAPVALDRFVAKFPEAARIIDADRVLDERFPLKSALATAEADGLLFAVHEVFRAEDDMFFVVSSVRGTPEYLKQNPPRRRRMNLQTTILDVANQPTAPGNHRADSGRATLADAEAEGVQYLWWLAARRRYYSIEDGVRTDRGESPSLEFEPGRVRLPLTASFRGPRANQPSANVDVVIALPTDTPAKSLLELAARTRRDILMVQQSSSATYALHGGIKHNGRATLEADKVTDAAYAQELTEQFDWLHSMDKVSWPPIMPPSTNGTGIP